MTKWQKNAVFSFLNLLSWGSVLGDWSGSLGNSVFAQLARNTNLDGRLNVLGGHGMLSCFLIQGLGFFGDRSVKLENDGIHGVHSSLWHSNFRMHLLEHFIDGILEGFLSFEKWLLLSFGWSLLIIDGFSSIFGWSSCWHFLDVVWFLINFYKLD